MRISLRPQVAPHGATVPPGTRVYAIGDIHGRVDLLRSLHAQIEADATGHAGRRVLIYLGDYVDRGKWSREVIDVLLDEKPAGFETVHLMGNHERAMLDFLDDAAAGPMWFMNGGLETLRSYGVPAGVIAQAVMSPFAAQAELRARLPSRHRDFLSALTLTHVEGDYLFVHAGIRPSVPLTAQRAHDLLWIREEFLSATRDHGKVVVHGHTISAAPEERPNRIGIDTGAFATGRLTCLCLEGPQRRFFVTGAHADRPAP